MYYFCNLRELAVYVSLSSGTGAVPTALGSLFHAHCPLWQSLSLTPRTPPTQLHAVPSGPVAVTQSRAQRCPLLPVRSCSRHQASPQPALLQAEQYCSKGEKLVLWLASVFSRCLEIVCLLFASI